MMEQRSSRILVVDDDYTIRKKLETILIKNGFIVKTVESGSEALDTLTNDSGFDLILLDVTMRGISGFETALNIKRNNSDYSIPIIFITGNVNQDDKKKGFEAGGVDYITKPFDNNEVLMRVKLHLELSHRRKEALDYARLLETRVRERTYEINQNKKALIVSLSKLAESRDPETGEHIIRTQSYSKLLSEELAKLPEYKDLIDAEFIELMFDCSPLHDIGKVGIKDDILLKPGKLTEEEFKIMRAHCYIGKKTLDSGAHLIKDKAFLKFASEIAYSHHEKYDGSGYPRKLSGENIPIQGRIMALADVYDALSTKRVYKDAWTHDDVRNYIIEQKGKHFDPKVVDAFLKIENEFINIYNKYKD